MNNINKTNNSLYYDSHKLQFQKYNLVKSNQSHIYKLVVNITSNNIFCTLINLKDQKTSLQLSAGKCNIICSKKLLKYATKIVLESFLKQSEVFLLSSEVIVKFSGPVRLRRFVLNSIFYNLRLFKVSKIFFDIKQNKCFNGCRPAKKKRKKNKGLRLFK